MIAEIGHFSLVLSLFLSLVQAIVPLWGGMKGDVRLMNMAFFTSFGQFFFTLFAFFCLVGAYIFSDFSVLNVWQNSHSAKPLFYKISGVWGNHEGSMLLWGLVLSFWGCLFSLFSAHLPLRLRADVLSVQGAIGVAFFLFILFTSNPFLRLETVPFDGEGLSSVLQDPALAIHPPLLYMGYVGFSLAFSFAVAALIEGRIDAAWALWVRPWTLLAWLFLTGGIAMGSWWAYYELGWGGWWFWDPVENASLMPWLTGTALLHSAVVMEKRGALKIWTILLAILTFSLSLLGTFLVRSGILTSVHSFAVDPARGLFILFILGFFTGGSLILFLWRAPLLQQGGLFAPISREGALVVNNLFLLSSTATVLIGTFYPLLLDQLTGTKISVGPPFFNLTFGPLMCILLVLLPFGPMLPWKRGDILGVAQRLVFVAFFSILGAALLVWIKGGGPLWALSGLGLGLWLVSGAFFEVLWRIKFFRGSPGESWIRFKSLPRSSLGTMCAHAGVGITVLGVFAMVLWQEEHLAVMSPGDKVEIAGYDLYFEGTALRKKENYTERVGFFKLREGGVLKADIEASRRSYVMPRETMSEVGLSSFLAGDLYVVLGEMHGDGDFVVRVYANPLVNFIWLGAVLMIIGGLFSFSDKRLHSGILRHFFKRVWGRLYEMVTLFTLALFFLVSAPVPGNGAIASLEYEEVFDDPLLEARARSLSRQIRCVVCQNQSIAGSGADIARAMRFRVRERLRKGDSDGEVLNHFAERYGDFILLRPSVKGNTLFLWFFPPFILIFGACLVWILSRRYSPVVNDGETGELTPDEADRVRTLLEERLPS